MILTDLIASVVEAIDDPSFLDPEITDVLNRGVNEIAGLVDLPALETYGDLYVGKAAITATTISFAAATNIISDSGKAFITSGFHVGQTITITGAAQVGNNQTTTITAMATDGSSMTVAGTLTTEGAANSVTIVNDGPSFVSLPSDYQLGKAKNLYRAYSVSHNQRPRVYSSLRHLLAAWRIPDQSGPVYAIAVSGPKLYYQRVPQTPERIRIYYYRNPVAMVSGTDSPDGIPEHLQKSLLVSYVSKELFALIEDGIEQQQVNTDRYEKRFGEALAMLIKFLGPSPEEPIDMPMGMPWEDLI